jgi:tetratricopeptide (TPR) repeat protein
MKPARARLAATLLAACFLASATAAPPAFAQDRDPKEEARGRFQRGVELYRDGDYRGALIEFNRAYQTSPNFRLLFNVGQTCVELQDYACALRAFEKYLADGKNEAPADRRATAEAEVKRLQKLVGYIRIVVDQPGAEVLIDNVSIGKTPLAEAIMVGSGRRTVQVLLPPNPPSTRAVDVAGGDRVDVKIDLGEAPKPRPAEPKPTTVPVEPPRRQEPPPPPRSTTPIWIGVATTGVLTAGTVVFGLVTLSAKTNLDKANNALQPEGSTAAIDDARTKLKRDALVTDILGATAIVSAGITAYLALSSGSSPAKTGSTGPSVRVAVSPFGAMLDGRF